MQDPLGRLSRWAAILFAIGLGCGNNVAFQRPFAVDLATPPPQRVPASIPAPTASKLHVWFQSDVPIHVFVMERATIVLRILETMPEPSVILPAYQVAADALRPEPRFFDGMEAPTLYGIDSLKTVVGTIETLAGDWPHDGKLVLAGGPLLTTASYAWRGGRWSPVKSCSSPAWYSLARGDPSSFVALRDSHCLYEKADDKTGIPKLYLDPRAAHLAPIQRMEAPPNCGRNGPRVSGRAFLRGKVTPSGALVAVGNDCVTGEPAVEYWPPGATQSRIVPLASKELPMGTTPRILESPSGDIYIHQPDAYIVHLGADSASDAAPRAAPVSHLEMGADGTLWAMDGELWRRGPGEQNWEQQEASPCGAGIGGMAAVPGGVWVSCEVVAILRQDGWDVRRLPEDIIPIRLTHSHDDRLLVVGRVEDRHYLLAESAPAQTVIAQMPPLD